jgi:hypothetical protein
VCRHRVPAGATPARLVAAMPRCVLCTTNRAFLRRRRRSGAPCEPRRGSTAQPRVPNPGFACPRSPNPEGVPQAHRRMCATPSGSGGVGALASQGAAPWAVLCDPFGVERPPARSLVAALPRCVLCTTLLGKYIVRRLCCRELRPAPASRWKSAGRGCSAPSACSGRILLRERPILRRVRPGPMPGRWCSGEYRC